MEEYLKYYTYWVVLYCVAHGLGAPIPNPKAILIGATIGTIIIYFMLDKDVSLEYRRDFILYSLVQKGIPLYLYRNAKVTPDGILVAIILGIIYLGYLKSRGLSYDKVYDDLIMGLAV
jgi:hypothetical protein